MMATVPRKGEFYDTESGSGEWAGDENYGDGTTREQRIAAARAPGYDDSDKRQAQAQAAKAPEPAKKSTAKKAPIVTKEQLAKSGFTNLRDYMNDKAKLKRRDGKAPASKSPSVSSAVMNDETRKRQSATKSPSPNYSNEGRSAAKQAVENYSNEGRGRPAPITTKPELGPMAAGRYSPGYARQLDQTEQKRIGRLEQGRIRDAENNAKRQAERDQFNAAMRNDPKQQEIRAAREKAEGMTPGQRSAERGKAVKEFFGYAKGGTVSAASKRADGIAQRGKTRCKVC
jgi:hypothetical protein